MTFDHILIAGACLTAILSALAVGLIAIDHLRLRKRVRGLSARVTVEIVRALRPR